MIFYILKHKLTLFSRFLLLGFIYAESLRVDEKTGLIYKQVDAVLIQNHIEVKISIEATSKIDVSGGIEKFTNKCVRNKYGINITEELEGFAEKRLNERIRDGLKRSGLPYGTVTKKSSKPTELDTTKSETQLASDDPGPAIHIIGDSDDYFIVDFNDADIYKKFRFCFGRDLVEPELDVSLTTKESSLSQENDQQEIWGTGFTIKENADKHRHLYIGKLLFK